MSNQDDADALAVAGSRPLPKRQGVTVLSAPTAKPAPSQVPRPATGSTAILHPVLPRPAQTKSMWPDTAPRPQGTPPLHAVQPIPAAVNTSPAHHQRIAGSVERAPRPAHRSELPQTAHRHGEQPVPAYPTQALHTESAADQHGGIFGGVEDVGGKILRGADGAAKAVEAVTSTGARVVLDLAALLPYAEYYGAYQTAKAINTLDAKGGTAGSIVSHLLASPLTSLEFRGLVGDVLIDLLKGESVRDEQGEPRYINPLHSFVPPRLRGPRLNLPGVGEHGIDFQW